MIWQKTKKCYRTTVFAFFVFISFQSKADTIDFWKFRCNNEKTICKEYSFTFSKNDVSSRDTLFVEYITDAPCYQCEHNLYFESSLWKSNLNALNSKPNSIIKIPLAWILEWNSATNLKRFDAYYKVLDPETQKERILVYLFTVYVNE